MTIDVATAHSNLIRSREAVAAAELRRTEAEERLRMLARASLTDSDPEAMARLAKATDEAATARLAVDTAAIVAAEAEAAHKEARAAAELAKKQAAADAIRAEAARLIEACEKIEALGAEIGKLAHECVELELSIGKGIRQRYGAVDTSFFPEVRDKLKESLKTLAHNASKPHNGIYGVVASANRQIERFERDVFFPDLGNGHAQ